MVPLGPLLLLHSELPTFSELHSTILMRMHSTRREGQNRVIGKVSSWLSSKCAFRLELSCDLSNPIEGRLVERPIHINNFILEYESIC